MTPFYHSKQQSFPTTPGIYRITCTVTGKIYIGSAVNLWKRRKDHRHHLAQGIHKNPKLQAAWNKYGKDTFSFDILELVLVPEMLTAREQYWFDALKPFGNKGFNIARVAGSNLGMKHTPESIARIKASKTGKPGNRKGAKATPETIDKLKKSHLGKKLSEETKNKIKVSNLNKPPVSFETREKIRTAKLKHPVSTETREKISASKTGHTYTSEVYEGRMKTLIVTSPDGTEYVVHGIKKFCREHNLDCSSLMRVAKGSDRGITYAQHKGWKARFP